MKYRSGIGYDVHPLVGGYPLVIGGVKIPSEKGSKGHSDGDALIHAICDALLGAAGMGDIGELFPDSEPEYSGVESRIFLVQIAQLFRNKGIVIENIDSVVILEKPKIGSYRDEMKHIISNSLGIEKSNISVKATTTEQLGFAGRGEGVAAQAIALISLDS